MTSSAEIVLASLRACRFAGSKGEIEYDSFRRNDLSGFFKRTSLTNPSFFPTIMVQVRESGHNKGNVALKRNSTDRNLPEKKSPDNRKW